MITKYEINTSPKAYELYKDRKKGLDIDKPLFLPFFSFYLIPTSYCFYDKSNREKGQSHFL